MSKFGLLVTSPIGPDKNIGDYIQSLAALQYIPTEYEYVEKEYISDFESKEKVKCIMNAWYIWHPENWPPKEECIDPLLTSVHITPLKAKEMLENGGKDYFIKHGPIGCRDTGTLQILEENNVPAYFSGCLTLTLGRKYKYEGQRDGVIFVDPYFPPIRYIHDDGVIYYPSNVLKSLFYFLSAPKAIYKLAKKEFFKGRFKFQTYYNASIFYHAYSSMFDDEVLMNAEYISHMVKVTNETTQEDLLITAENLLKKYAKAKYVITSRIHCALPCLGLDTPVGFVIEDMMMSNKNIFNAPGRFGGLINLFRVLSYGKNRLFTNDEVIQSCGRLSKDTMFKNKDNWKTLRDKLVIQCMDFVKKVK